jgi:hypothetical protein
VVFFDRTRDIVQERCAESWAARFFFGLTSVRCVWIADMTRYHFPIRLGILSSTASPSRIQSIASAGAGA